MAWIENGPPTPSFLAVETYMHGLAQVGICTFTLIEIQNNAIPLISLLFLTHPKQWIIPEKIDEFDPVSSFKNKKGWILHWLL